MPAESLTDGVILGPPVSNVAGFDRGERLLGELDCVACHAAAAAVRQRLFSRQAPLLGDVGARVTPQWLRAFLTHPQQVQPGTSMPDVLHGLDLKAKRETVEALVQFLVSLNPGKPGVAVAADELRIRAGRLLYHRIGCVACHAPQEPLSSLRSPGQLRRSQPQPRATAQVLVALQASSVPLGNLAMKTTVSALAAFLRNPLAVRPSGRMPSLSLTQGQATDIAMYLLRGQLRASHPGKPPLRVRGLRYEYFEHQFTENAPDFDALTPEFSGAVPRFTLSPRKRNEDFGFRFRGTLSVPVAGRYTFYLASDDGSRLYLDGRLVVQNDGQHAETEKTGALALRAGGHPIVVTYFNAGGPFSLKVSWRGPAFQKQILPASRLSYLGQPMQPLGQEPFVRNPGEVRHGRELFASLGCAACHAMGGGEPAIRSTLAARPLAELDPSAPDGCIAARARAGAPQYHLTPAQRAAARATLSRRPQLAKRSAARTRVMRLMATLNCFACHTRDGAGGPERGRAVYFATIGSVDLGDEGRIPPGLTGVGAKLRPDWLRRVLLNGAAVRPYMAAHMPQYGEANVGVLVAAFEAADGGGKPDGPLDFRDAKYGRKLIGTDGLSCISCHFFAGHKSLGAPAIDLTWMTRRLTESWFHRYLLDPQALRPGTRMPAFWPEGKSARTDILGGNADRQIKAIWAFLSLGARGGLPTGLIRGRMELVASNEAVIYRNFIAGVSPRAIGVGYPEKANLAFDAQQLRLALIWQGPFIDAAQQRTGRGEGFVPPMGYNVVTLPPGPPFAILESPHSPWPKTVGQAAGYRMRGYELEFTGERRPTFLYTFREIHVADFPEARPGELKPFFRRRLTLRAAQPVDHLWFRAWAGSSVQAKPDGAYLADGKVTLRLRSIAGAKPLIRPDHGTTELVVPVTFIGPEARIVEDIIW